MPFVHVSSNVPKASVDAATTIRALSKSLSAAMDRPEHFVMVKLELENPMLFQASDAPCAMVNIRSIGKIDAERNPKTAAAITVTVAETLNLSADRVFLVFDDIAGINWAMGGNTLENLKE